jgi:AcrR family transcriptional regulator
MMIREKRSEIMQAALEIISARGFHGAPMAEIAERAGVAAGTIYRYFESKEVLISELHRELEEGINAKLLAGYPSAQPLRERFLYLAQTVIRHFIANPLHFSYMEQFLNSPFGITRHRDTLLGKPGKHDMVMSIFTEGTAQQILKDLPKAVLFSLAFGPLIALMRDHRLGFVTLDDALIEQISEASWDAIRR